MRINLSHLLRLLQWSSYTCTLLLVKLFVVFPLAVLLFHDFYLRLLPADSSSWVPFDILPEQNHFWHEYSRIFTQKIERIDIDNELPKTLDNGLSQPIFLRDHILYKMDLNLQFYCIHLFNDKPKNNVVEFELNIFNQNSGEKLFAKRIPIACLTEELPTSLGVPSSKYGSSVLELYRREWLNVLKLDDKIEIHPKIGSIKLELRTGQPTQLILEPESSIKFRMHFSQGLINLMLRWHKTAYILGIILFDLTITSLFSISTLVTFTLVSKRLPSDDHKTS